MRYRTPLIVLIFWLVYAFAFAGYYDDVIDLTGEALRLALTNLISTNTNTNYNGAKLQMFGYFDNVNGYVRCVYTGQDFAVPQGGMPNQNILNTEHTYAQSWFSPPSSNIKKADLHHLFPTNAQVNSSRGNLPFDWVANYSNATTYTSYNGYHSYRGMNAQNRLVFEPAVQHKGNVARSLLYFNIRYGDPLLQQNVDMIPTFLQWHILDPVDNAELQRNQNIYNYQNNRNPFIDHPEFVARIWGNVSADDPSLIPSPLMINAIYPNPFNDVATILIRMPVKQAASLDIYNLKGQKMHSLHNGVLSDGDHSIVFDARNNQGISLPSGVYLLLLSTSDQIVIKKVVLIR